MGRAALLADAETPPFEVDARGLSSVGEEARLRYRYLDLRRSEMQAAIELRARLTRAMREALDGDGFLEIETPVLTRSTPEGARDFLVPSRLQQGSFFALPQSPQLFKQLLMVSGFERYYQIARCFRDEDLRADRQPDFTQLDIEMSFVEVEDVIETNERLMKHVLAAAGIEIELPLPRIPYDEAMARFGTDRPDVRFGMELADLSEDLRDTEFRVFRGTLDSGGVVKGMNCGARELPRAQLDGLISRGPGARRQGPGMGVPRGGRMALADREVPHRGRADRAQLAPRRERGRPAARGRRLPRRRQRGPRDPARPPG